MILLSILFCYLPGFLSAQNDSSFSRLSTFKLYDVSGGRQASLPDDPKTGLSVFIFLSPECPLSQNYLPLLNSLQATYTHTVSFYGIIPGKAYPAKTVRSFASEYNIQFPLLIDSSKALTRYMRAAVTPEVILLNEQNNVVYRGAIDDLVMGLGKRRVTVKNEYLKNSIALSLEKKTIPLKRTKATGCRINDY